MSRHQIDHLIVGLSLIVCGWFLNRCHRWHSREGCGR